MRPVRRGYGNLMKGAEDDVFSGWRHVYKWTLRAGAKARVKRRYRRRERREGKRGISQLRDDV